MVINAGRIKTQDTGFVVLMASAIENSGKIEAPMETVALAGGDLITIGVAAGGKISIGIDKAIAENIFGSDAKQVLNQIKNTGVINVSGGRITLSTQHQKDLFRSSISLDGILNATDVRVNRCGEVELVASSNLQQEGIINTDDIVVNVTRAKLEGKLRIRRDFNITDDAEVLLGGRNFLNSGTFIAEKYSSFNITDIYPESNFLGDNTFYNIECTLPDKKLYFEAGKTQTVLAKIYILGRKSHLIGLYCTQDGISWNLKLLEKNAIKYIFVKNIRSTEGILKIQPAINLGGSINIDTDPKIRLVS